MKEGKTRLCVYVDNSVLAKFHEACDKRKKARGKMLEELLLKLDEFLEMDEERHLYWSRQVIEEALFQYSINEGYRFCKKPGQYMELKETIEKYLTRAEAKFIKWDRKREKNLLSSLDLL